ncbi:MAG: hypothetical protein PHX16_04150 [Syntrophaceticus sp.]|nr:hypothetical protein [Syntrophaceticus sp.]MDD4359824.1 hypothetical protein [Syntrophaceticus sp.]MDD4782819.1 hypothetical protein [Syntrophaceticus sp.]HBG22423.1 hypothetical protein [Peptococcaceae bacterium]HBI27319.1 hypothetical protein [Peptococcaceae bacterium]
MDQMNLPLIIFQGIPETAIMVVLALVLTGHEAKLKDVLIVGVIGGLIGAVVRSLPISLGVNILIMLPIIGVLIAIFCKIGMLSAIIVAGIGAIVIGITETAYIFTFVKITGITIKQIMSDLYTRLLFPLPEYAILILLIFICKRYYWTLLNIREFNDIRRIKDYER